MADVLRIKRRPVGGAATPPTSLAASELAFNEQTNILYYGGGNSLGLATSIFAIGGPGAFFSLTGGTVTGATSINALFNAGGINLNAVLPTNNSTGMGVGWNYSAGLGETDLFNYYSPSTANSFSFYQYTTATTATRIAMMSLTGINATAIGATTASTGSFTTLAASGTLGVGGQISSTGGLTFGSTVAGSSSTLSRHIELYNPGYGFSITGGRLNIVTGSTTVFVVGSGDVGTITGTGLNNMAVGATTPSTGSFTTLAASGTATTAAINAGGIVTVGTDTVAQNLILNGPVVSRVFRFQTASLNRWHINCNNTAEGGANAGSNLDISCYDDAGATLMSPVIRITRSTQTTNFFGPLTAISAPVGTTDITVATTLFAARLLGYLNNAATIPDADTTLTVAQVGQRVVRFATALTADRTYTLPSTNQRNWVLWNNTTGGYSLIFTLGGTTINIPNGFRGEIFSDGANIFAAHSCLPAGTLRIGPGGDRNAVLITTGATAAAATTIEATGTGAINWITGLGFGTAVAPGGVADLTRHLALYSTTYGFSVTSLRLNYNAPVSAAHVFLVNGTDVGSFTSAGAQLTGTPTAPTAAATTNTTQIATTAFVKSISVVVATIAALRALNTTATYVYVQGYYAIGDGGGGDYVKAGAGTDNGGSIIVSANGKFYLQTYGNPINVMQFGAVGDGVTNDSTAIQNAINAVQTAGGGIVKFPAKVFAHTTQLVVGQSGVRLEGSGMDGSHDYTPVWTNYSNMRPVTALLWTGANNGNQVLVAPQANNDAGGALGGCAVVNMNFIAGAFPFTVAAASAVVVEAVKDSEFSFFALEHKYYGLLFTCLNRSTTWNNAVSFCRIPYLGYRGTASTAGGALRMDGIDLVGNCYNNMFGMINVLHNNGHAIDLYSCDNNVFETVRIQRIGGGVGAGVYFRPGATADTPARANLFNLLSPGAGGVNSDATAAFPPYENKIQYYNPDENGAPANPSIGTGSTLFYSTTKQSGNTNFSATTSADQTITSGSTAVKVAFNAVLIDPAFWYDTTNRRWWARYPGVYVINAAVLFEITAAVGSRHIYIYKNATTIIAQTQVINRFTSGADSISVTASVYFNGTTDYVEIFVQQDSGVNGFVRNTSNTTNLFMGTRAA